MSKRFYAVNRETGERWKRKQKGDYLVMYDSGYLAEVTQDWYTYIKPLDTNVWKVVVKDNIKNKP